MASDMPERPSLSPWTVELPRHEAIDSEFGNCRGIEHRLLASHLYLRRS